MPPTPLFCCHAYSAQSVSHPPTYACTHLSQHLFRIYLCSLPAFSVHPNVWTHVQVRLCSCSWAMCLDSFAGSSNPFLAAKAVW